MPKATKTSQVWSLGSGIGGIVVAERLFRIIPWG